MPPSSELPTPAEPAQARFMDLEVKLAFLEDLVEQLNQVVIRQQGQIELLVREVTRLRQEGAAAEPSGFRSLRDELPPHY